ncbi:MAG: CRTAC1 family protein, partial [Bacteroidota bacterium]
MALIIFGLPNNLQAQLFSEQAVELGIEHHAFEATAMAGGLAIFDFDNDGYEDIYFTGGDAPDKLFHNQGNGHFVDVTQSMRLTVFNIVTTMGVVTGDIDNDGYTDLFVTTTGQDHCYLLRNVAGKYFEDISLAAGIRHEAWSTTATMADYDEDGDLDIYVGNYVTFSEQPFEHNITNPEADFFYRNEGDGTFSLQESLLGEDQAGCTLVTAFSDYDRDGDQDLFVLNDFGDFYEPNKLLNNGPEHGAFSEIGVAANVNAAINSMGIAAGDINEDGRLDYYVTNIGQNPFYLSNPNGGFTDLATDFGVNDGEEISWGTVFTDVDNDGILDLFFANGDLSQSTVNADNKLFLGNGPALPFTDVSEELLTPGRNKARGVAVGDLNNDGYPDIAVSNVRVSRAHGVSSRVYLNGGTPGNNWLSLSLEGTTSNRSAYGALVEVFVAGRRQLRELSGGGSYLSSNSSRLIFGLGEATGIDSIIIYWPAPGGREVLTALNANNNYVLKQGEPLLIKTTAMEWLCPGASKFLAGAEQTEPGIYRDVIAGDNLDTLRITRLSLREDGIPDCTQISSVADDVLVYPNPVQNSFTINFPSTLETMETTEVRLYA